eukprot:ANDGO_02659.mRNA.1 hypothetical protein GUITHDRAFT_149904
MTKVGKDTVPHMSAAGFVPRKTTAEESVSGCLSPNAASAEVPDQLKRFSRTANSDPGKQMVHYGKAYDAPPPDIRFGMPNIRDGSAKDSLNPDPLSTVSGMLQQETEKRAYKSVHTEPLGRSITRDYNYPREIKENPQFSFGVTSRRSDSAKEALYPLHPSQESASEAMQRTHAMYTRTHGDYEAGEQKHRGYNWEAAGVDPSSFSFGSTAANPTRNGVHQALHADEVTEANGSQASHIVDARVEAMRRTKKGGLGEIRPLGATSPNVVQDPDFVFGLPSGGAKSDPAKESHVGDCIQYSQQQLEQDLRKDAHTLGKPIARGLRPGEVREVTVDPRRSFGVPSVRRDIPMPRMKSVADNSNYGNEPDARSVVFPPKYGERGVFEEDFAQPRTKSELFSIVNIAFGTETAEFDALFDETLSSLGKSSADRVSVEQFRKTFDRLQLSRSFSNNQSFVAGHSR